MVYGLMALGLSVIFGVMRVVNFAHGEMMIVGMYLAWMGFDTLQLDPTYSLPLIAIVWVTLVLDTGARTRQPLSWDPILAIPAAASALAVAWFYGTGVLRVDRSIGWDK